MSSPNSTNINPKDCVYGCNTRIYWNTLISEYWEVFTKKKLICPNRSSINNKSVAAAPTNNNTTSKPTHHNNNYKNNYNNNYNYKKSWTPKYNNNKQSMDNSLEISQGTSTDVIRKHYEVLADLIKEYNGKTHGSQSHILANNSIQLIVYYEVPEGMREELKRKFEDFTRNEIKIYHQHQQQRQQQQQRNLINE
ncbi:MAG: hypothetical protein H0X03_08215 [Nitrosopumilus sp.]|nr:hypothetical protein [Nitrosopumilus sp.]